MDLLIRPRAAGAARGALILAAALAVGAASAAEIPYHEGFDGPGAPGWTLSGSWHVRTAPEAVRVSDDLLDGIVSLPDDGFWPLPYTGASCLVVADDSTGTYVAPRDPADTLDGSGGTSTAARKDTATTPVFAAGNQRNVRLSFRTWWEVESVRPDSADLMIVEYTNDGGSTWHRLDALVDSARAAAAGDGAAPIPLSSGGYDVSPVWESRVYIAPTGADGDVAFRFIFDTVDSLRNGFRGWFLDDISIACEGLYPPYGLVATDTLCNGVALSWSDSSTANPIYYSIGRSHVDSTRMDTLSTIASTLLDSTAVPGVPYRYVVWGNSLCGASGYSNADSGARPAAPAAPGSFAASDTLCGAVHLAWTDLSSDEQGHLVFRNDTLLAVLGPNVTEYDDGAVAAGAKNAYAVAAYNWCDTLVTAVDTGMVRATPPDPLAVDASDYAYCNLVTVSWDTTGGDFDSWVVFRGGDSIAAVARGAVPFWSDGAAPAAVPVVYTVKGRSACGFSAGAVSDTGARIGAPPVPAGVAATDDRCDEVEVSWSPPSAPGVIDSFIVRRDGARIAATAGSVFSWIDTTGLVDVPYAYSVLAKNTCATSAPAAADTGRQGAAPPAPTGVAATDALCDSVVITWSAVAGPYVEYVVYRDGDSIGAVPLGSETVFRDGTVDSMTTASYDVRVRSACGISSPSAADEGLRVGLPPTPVNCSATDSLCGRVTVTWQHPAAPGAIEYYVVFRDGDSIVTVGSDTLFYNDSDASPGVPHGYAVRSRNACGISVSAAEDSGTYLVAPGAVSSFTATKDLCAAVRLEWTPPTSGGAVTGYRIVRSEPPGGTLQFGPGQLSYVDTPGVAEVVYEIRAFNCEESEVRIDTGRASTAPPPAPASCAVTRLSCSSVRLTWPAVLDAAWGYAVVRDGAVLVDSVGPDSLGVTDVAVTAGVDHTWRVYAVNGCGRSVTGRSATGRIPGPLGPAPAGACSASRDSCDGIRVSWTWTHPDLAWFKIYRVDDGALLDSVGAAAHTFLDTSPAFGDTVAYAVRAGNDCYVSTSACTTEGSRPRLPSAPQQCSASDNLCDRVRVSWVWPSEYLNQNILGFRIYRSRNDQPSMPPDTFTVAPRIGAVSYDDNDVVAGAAYFYRIVAYNRCGTSPGGCQSPGAATSVPGAPSLVSPADGAADLTVPLKLRWRKRARATDYRLEIGRDSAMTESVVDTTTRDTVYTLVEIDSTGPLHWRVTGINECGSGVPSATRTFAIGLIPGLELISGSRTLAFGNREDSTYAESTLVVQNLWFNEIAWSAADTLSWLDVTPESGVLGPGETDTIHVAIGAHRCGAAVAGSLTVTSDPLPPGRTPIGVAVSLDPEPRPAGDVNWDCVVGVSDAADLVDGILAGGFASADDSAGADANSDGRINVADVVWLGAKLAREEPPAEPVVAGTFDLAFVPDEMTLRLAAGFPLRAARATFDVREAAGARFEAIDPSRAAVAFDEGASRLSVFWFSMSGTGEEEALLFRVEGGGAPRLAPRRIEVAGASGETIRMALGGTSIETDPAPARVTIEGIRPNPFNPATTIRFTLPAAGRAAVRVYDVRGARVRTLFDGPLAPGRHEAVWDGKGDGGRDAASGVYFARIETAGETATARMVLVR